MDEAHVVRVMAPGYALLDWIHSGTLSARCTKEPGDQGMSGYVPNPPKNFRYDEAKPVDIHAKRWAEYEKYGKAPAAAKEKVRVALRIGVFFDGTLNNAGNSASGPITRFARKTSMRAASRIWRIRRGVMGMM